MNNYELRVYLTDRLKKVDPENEQAFCEIIRLVIKEGMFSQESLAEKLTVNPEVVPRWIEGKNNSHPLARQSHYEVILRETQLL